MRSMILQPLSWSQKLAMPMARPAGPQTSYRSVDELATQYAHRNLVIWISTAEENGDEGEKR